MYFIKYLLNDLLSRIKTIRYGKFIVDFYDREYKPNPSNACQTTNYLPK